MQSPISLKSAERKVFQTAFSDGLWDILLGCFVLEFAIAPLLSKFLGDFWSSFIFLPFWGVLYLAIWLVRKYVVRPRIGTVHFGGTRKKKLQTFTLVLLLANTAVFVLGLLAFFVFDQNRLPTASPLALLGLFLLAAFSMAAFFLDASRLYGYGLILFLAPLAGEWLYNHLGAAHHGFPIVFGTTAGIMVITGLVLFVRLLKNNPVVDTPQSGDGDA